MPQSFACQSVPNIVDMVYDLRRRVADANLVVNDRSVYIQKHILVNCYGQDESSVLAIERRKIRAAATQRDSIRRSRQNHICSAFVSCSGNSGTAVQAPRAPTGLNCRKSSFRLQDLTLEICNRPCQSVLDFDLWLPPHALRGSEICESDFCLAWQIWFVNRLQTGS